MVRKQVTVRNRSGLHLRPASTFANLAASCASDVVLIKGDKRVNPKSVLMLMTAAVMCGETIELECSGPTEEADREKLIAGIESGLGEEVI